MPGLVALIAGLAPPVLAAFQAWCQRNPGATPEDAVDQLRRMNASDQLATDEYHRNKDAFAAIGEPDRLP